ncbi:heme-copper oxidase subunit III [Micromonospora sp. NPDC049679]|uniref:cytochrome c oxidase subunit 3 n=1 Tax=Micromonospora sp. NPDC049679 TaxID=3155920 RepID=UPI0033E2D6EA
MTEALIASPDGGATGPAALATELPRGRSPGWWGMLLFVTTEATLFAVLLGSYFYLRFQAAAQWPPPRTGPPELTLPLVMTALLLPSSLPVIWAEHGIRRGQRWRLRLGLALTLLLGLAFVGLLLMEYDEKLASLTVTTDTYGSLFYVVTGFHGLHVTVGLLMLAWLLAASTGGRLDARRHEPVRLVAMYWHFVGAVWVAVLFTVYLSPRL